MAEAGARQVDLVVLGGGAGGMTAALTGALLGLDVELLEKAEVIGGSTAISAGSVWVPNSHHAPPGSDSPDQARRYLFATIGNRLRPALCGAFLRAGPEMVRFLEAKTEVRLREYPHHPDYLADAPGATLAGRVLEAVPFDGRRLGRHFPLLREPLPEFTLLGGMMVDRADVAHLLHATGSVASARHVLSLIARYGRDRLRHHRGTRLVMGNALAGRLLNGLLRRGVPIRTRAQVLGLIERRGRIAGVTVAAGSTSQGLLARRGVVLATGGFSRHPFLRQQLLPAPTPEHSPLIPEVTGTASTWGWRRAAGSAKGTRRPASGHPSRSARAAMAAPRCSRISCWTAANPG